MLFALACSSPKTPAILEAEALIPEHVDYNFHVKPILADRCFACHGPDNGNREAGLRLDLSEFATAELPESPGKYAIKEGNLRKSEIFHRIVSDDPDQVMPPPSSKLSLSDQEKAILSRWIEQGADYKPHWAFLPVSSREETSIDHFVQSHLAEKQIKAAEKASKETLIRRISFDLTGLPPRLEEVDAFLEDNSSNAYEKVVDRLLASEAYGERMAAHWLDVARYADSDGYLDDKHRDFSPWRDWVIRAFNENLPYDDFVTWQLAGDLMPNPSQDQILATAFNRLHKKNSEAGIVFEEYRLEYVADRTNTMGKAFLGLSLECARCHDHKFDPVSQKEYFQFFAFFNQTEEWGHAVYGPDQTPGPALMLSDEETQEQIDFLQALEQKQADSLAQLSIALSSPSMPSSTDLSSSIDQALVSHLGFDRIQERNGQMSTPDLQQRGKQASLSRAVIQSGVKGNAFFVTDYNSGKFPEKVGWFERTDPFSLDLWLYPDTIYEQASILTHCEDRRLGFKGYSLHLRNNQLLLIMAHSWPQNAIQIVSKPTLAVREWSQVSLTYDGSSKADGWKMYINGEEVETKIEVDHLYKGILYEYNIHTYGFHGIQFGYRNKLIPFKKGGLDELKVFNRDLTSVEVAWMHHQAKGESGLPDLSESQIQQHHAYHKSQPDRDRLLQTRKKINDVVNNIPEIMVMGDTAFPRPTYLLERGSYEQPGEEVHAGVPAFLPAFSDSLPKNRLGLAQWMFQSDHPLTARVIVNRIWQLHFGRGLVETSEDFGNQGALPSHPELLDWLAQWFIENDWDLKALHKLIVMSKTYQQSSAIRPEVQELDPENVWLARGPSFRLPAEMIRDNALAMSQLLVQETGGQSAFPYQPAGLWDEISNKHWRYKYLQEPGPGLYRRSIYTVWKRTSPPPSMQIFDIADRDNCTVRRQETSTPLQALVLLNDPQYQEAARVTAEHILTNETEQDARLNLAFRMVTGRQAGQQEIDRIKDFWQKEKQYYETHPEEALAYLSVGEQKWNESFPPAELASLGITINGLMNTDEGYMRR